MEAIFRNSQRMADRWLLLEARHKEDPHRAGPCAPET